MDPPILRPLDLPGKEGFKLWVLGKEAVGAVVSASNLAHESPESPPSNNSVTPLIINQKALKLTTTVHAIC